MFKCTVCQRSYKTQTSLTRHARNHADGLSTSHSCDACGTSFARRDILSRHRQVAHRDNAQRPRQRCHTACESCRTARTRCDGHQPCGHCAATGKQCEYSRHGRRVSKPSRPAGPALSPTQASSQGAGPSAGSPRPPLSPTDTQDPMDGIVEPTIEDHDADAVSKQPLTFADSQLPTDAYPELFPTFTDSSCDWPVDLDGMSWPWLHETLFMNEEPLVTQLSTPAPSNLLGTVNQNSTFARTHENSEQTEIQPDGAAILNSEIDTVIRYATEVALGPETQFVSSGYWLQASSRLKPVLGDYDTSSAQPDGQTDTNQRPHIFEQAIKVYYLPKFNRLWPMFPGNELNLDSLHVVLYLVLVSIGSMYGSPVQQQFGMLLHKSLRRLLTASLFELERPETDLVWMAQARLLTQVQGLYFGQPQGFSYAQHLGAILVAQARRLGLFQQPGRFRSDPGNLNSPPKSEETKKRLQAEARKRLAFGILRADVFTSVLLNSRPLISYEEIDLTMPCSDELWRNKDGLSPDEQVLAMRVEERQYTPALFSDLLRILLDRREAQPAMRSVGYELCLFGLQAPIWKVSHDPDLFCRLTGRNYVRYPHSPSWEARNGHQTCGSGSSRSKDTHMESDSFNEIPEGLTDPTRGAIDLPQAKDHLFLDELSKPVRQMPDMRSDRDRVEAALETWDRNYQSMQSPHSTQHRDTIMSSLLLWYMSYLRLYAPLHQLHDISYRAGESQDVNMEASEQVHAWKNSKDASLAVSKALKICDLIHYELARPLASRASFNFLAFGSLHHAAVVLWTMSQTESESRSQQPEARESMSPIRRLMMQKDTTGLLKACAQLFREISPLGGASFGLAADRLAIVRCSPMDGPIDAV